MSNLVKPRLRLQDPFISEEMRRMNGRPLWNSILSFLRRSRKWRNLD